MKNEIKFQNPNNLQIIADVFCDATEASIRGRKRRFIATISGEGEAQQRHAQEVPEARTMHEAEALALTHAITGSKGNIALYVDDQAIATVAAGYLNNKVHGKPLPLITHYDSYHSNPIWNVLLHLLEENSHRISSLEFAPRSRHEGQRIAHDVCREASAQARRDTPSKHKPKNGREI